MIPFKLLYELAYEGNLGIQELMMFYRLASDEEKDLLEQLLINEDINEVIALIQRVTKVKLVPDTKGEENL